MSRTKRRAEQGAGKLNVCGLPRGYVNPSLEELARRMGASTHEISAWLKELEEKGWIETIHDHANNRTIRHLLVGIEDLLIEEPTDEN